MAFGFVIERFGLFVSILMPQHTVPLQRGISFWAGPAFVLLGAWVAACSTVQFRKVLKTLRLIETPEGYRTSPGVITNLMVAMPGIALTIYFFQGA